jgi:hypothetical protein
MGSFQPTLADLHQAFYLLEMQLMRTGELQMTAGEHALPHEGTMELRDTCSQCWQCQVLSFVNVIPVLLHFAAVLENIGDILWAKQKFVIFFEPL